MKVKIALTVLTEILLGVVWNTKTRLIGYSRIVGELIGAKASTLRTQVVISVSSMLKQLA